MCDHSPSSNNNDHTKAISKKTSKKPSKNDIEKLPTPPPDPRRRGSARAIDEKINTGQTHRETQRDHDKELLGYLEWLQKCLQHESSSSESNFVPAIVAEEAFEHLEKLYKLMNQMLDLREQNIRLSRRIRDLEHVSNIEKLQKHIDSVAGLDEDLRDLDKDAALFESILESILQDSNKAKNPNASQYYQKQKSVSGATLKPSILRRHRSGSATEKQVTLEADSGENKQEHVIYVRDMSDKPAKISKWTKVKAAFRWEKASTSVAEPQTSSKSQDSGLHIPMNLEIARYLRVPSTSDDTGHSPVDSGAGISTPGSLSSASSTDDLRSTDIRTPYTDFRSSDEESSNRIYIPKEKNQHNQKLPRTPWAKMKDIIQTRNSVKKKNRLSAASDDIHIDIELCSDNEDVFEDDSKSRTLQVSSSTPSPCSPALEYCRKRSLEISPDIIERYQKALEEDKSLENNKSSRWQRVRRAFLTNDNNQDENEMQATSVEEEIQRNYKKLQKKLSLEFQEKLSEWEMLKQHSPSSPIPSSSQSQMEETKDPYLAKKMEEWQKFKSHSPTNKPSTSQLTRDYELPPDFRKKLQEWEKIKRSGCSSNTSKKKLGEVPRWKSLSGHRSETSSSSTHAFEYPVISEDFRRKLEEWKQIKASGSLHVDSKKMKDKTPSPKLSRKNSSPKQSKKSKEKDTGHWFEKDLGKIDKENLSIDRQRQTFLEREERISKIRKTMMGGAKKEVLIHTPSGFHRFEGISRKFTQKLYEWEKAQGIRPEESTFALLTTSSVASAASTASKRYCTSYNQTLMRSKSADSIAMSALSLTHPLMSPQPSSLSLNDVEELENTCLGDSKFSSLQYLEAESPSDLMNYDEPEAVLVEVMDYEEETAEPLQSLAEKKHQPVYQHQEDKKLCEGETMVGPKIRRSESTRAQINYNLIENIIALLSKLAEDELELKNLWSNYHLDDQKQLQNLYKSQVSVMKEVTEKLYKLQEANSSVTSNISAEQMALPQNKNLADMLDFVQDLSMELLHLAENLEKRLCHRNLDVDIRDSEIGNHEIFEIIKEIKCKIMELRRHLSYVCAASDLTTPIRKISLSGPKHVVHKALSSESKDSRCDTSDNSRGNSQKENRYIKSDSASVINSSQGAVKKRIRYRQKSMHQKTIYADTDDEDYDEQKTSNTMRQHKKLTRTKSETIEIKCDDIVITSNKDTSPLQMKLLTSFPNESPVTVFVKTTRKLFTPIGQTNLVKQSEQLSKDQSEEIESNRQESPATIKLEASPSDPVLTLPPLHSSPMVQRKLHKDVSPSIRLMVAKYNQKISDQDCSGMKSGDSSGSNSPLWRSPTSERRVKAQTEKYQEDLDKSSPLLGQRFEVQKSASTSKVKMSEGFIFPRKASLTTSDVTALKKSAPKDQLFPKIINKSKKPNLTLNIASAIENVPEFDSEIRLGSHSPEVRLRKIQKAKEEFLSGVQSLTAPTMDSCNEFLSYPTRNRLSQISVGSETSTDSRTYSGLLMKSVSAGMINIEAKSYRQIDPEYHLDGYVSLPRTSSKKPKEGLLNSKFASIAAKFRKVKMRRGKNNKMDTVAKLCRQSLVVDINEPQANMTIEEGVNNNNNGDIQQNVPNDERNVQNPIAKSQSWIKRSFFKK